MTDIQKL